MMEELVRRVIRDGATVVAYNSNRFTNNEYV
jgi:hypothetical protein